MVKLSFDALIDAIEQLPDEAQAALVNIIRLRLAQRERARIISDARQGEEDFALGKCSAMSLDDLMREV